MDDSDDLEQRRKELEIRKVRLASLKAARTGQWTPPQPLKSSFADRSSTTGTNVVVDSGQATHGDANDGDDKKENLNAVVESLDSLAVNVESKRGGLNPREALLETVTDKYAADILGEDEDSLRPAGEKGDIENNQEGGKASEKDSLLTKCVVIGGGEKSRGRGISCLRWHPKYENVIVSTHVRTSKVPVWDLDDEVGLVMIWSLERASSNQPDRILRAHSDVLAIETLPIAAPTVIVGALLTGEIVMWDTRARQSIPVQKSTSAEAFHEPGMPVYNLRSTSNDSVLISGSRDGTVSIWSPSNLSTPCESFSLRRPSTKQSVCITALDIPNTARFGEGGASESGKSTFFGGDDEGNLFRIGNAPKRNVEVEHQGHSSPILSMNCHPSGVRWPQFSDLVLSASMDWTAGLWSFTGRECKRLSSFSMPVVGSVADAQWSPVHPGVFAAADGDSGLTIFDLSCSSEDQQSSRVCVALGEKKSVASVNKLQWSKDGGQLAAGDVTGRVHVYNASPYITSPPTSVWDDLSSRIRSWHASTAKES